MYVCMHVSMYVCTYVCIYVCMHVSICMYVCMHVCGCASYCMCVPSGRKERLSRLFRGNKQIKVIKKHNYFYKVPLGSYGLNPVNKTIAKSNWP